MHHILGMTPGSQASRGVCVCVCAHVRVRACLKSFVIDVSVYLNQHIRTQKNFCCNLNICVAFYNLQSALTSTISFYIFLPRMYFEEVIASHFGEMTVNKKG